jgi:SAM-dependent methyltransferase
LPRDALLENSTYAVVYQKKKGVWTTGNTLMLMEDFLGDGMELDGTSLGAYVHTSYAALEEAFQFAGIGVSSCVIDIGCGDGRAALVAAARFHCHAVGGIDCDAPLIEKFAAKAKSMMVAGDENESRCSSNTSELTVDSDTRVVCVSADALAWGKQPRLFYTAEELAELAAGSVVHVDCSTDNNKVLLPKPTHIYLYILQHRLKFLVPLLKRIRAEIPGVVIISAFQFEVRPPKMSGTGEEGDVSVPTNHENTQDPAYLESDYLDVPVAASFVESKGRLTFRIYK